MLQFEVKLWPVRPFARPGTPKRIAGHYQIVRHDRDINQKSVSCRPVLSVIDCHGEPVVAVGPPDINYLAWGTRLDDGVSKHKDVDPVVKISFALAIGKRPSDCPSDWPDELQIWLGKVVSRLPFFGSGNLLHLRLADSETFLARFWLGSGRGRHTPCNWNNDVLTRLDVILIVETIGSSNCLPRHAMIESDREASFIISDDMNPPAGYPQAATGP